MFLLGFPRSGTTLLEQVLAAHPRVATLEEAPTLAADPVIQPLLLIQSFYRLANALAIRRGNDPDRPPSLAKVTETL